MRCAFGLNRVDGDSNEKVYGRFGMCGKGEGMNCGMGGGDQMHYPHVVWSVRENRKKSNDKEDIQKCSGCCR